MGKNLERETHMNEVDRIPVKIGLAGIWTFSQGINSGRWNPSTFFILFPLESHATLEIFLLICLTAFVKGVARIAFHNQ